MKMKPFYDKIASIFKLYDVDPDTFVNTSLKSETKDK